MVAVRLFHVCAIILFHGFPHLLATQGLAQEAVTHAMLLGKLRSKYQTTWTLQQVFPGDNRCPETTC